MNGCIFNEETGNCAKLIAHKAGGLVQLYKNTATIICKLLIHIHTVQDIYMYIYIINDTYIIIILYITYRIILILKLLNPERQCIYALTASVHNSASPFSLCDTELQKSVKTINMLDYVVLCTKWKTKYIQTFHFTLLTRLTAVVEGTVAF